MQGEEVGNESQLFEARSLGHSGAAGGNIFRIKRESVFGLCNKVLEVAGLQGLSLSEKIRS